MKKEIRRLVMVLMLVVANGVLGQTFTYTFDTNDEGWSGDFADYPPGEEVFYELDFGHDVLPPSITPLDHGLRIEGNNHSDDLIMFVKKHITGLMPVTTYQVGFELEVASCAPTGAIGVGGAPGEGVQFLAGATIQEPDKVIIGGFYRMNIDFGGQNNPGADSDTLGHVGVSDTATVFAIIHRDNLSHPFTVTTDANGEVWVCIGTDSGYEALTVLYYTTITIGFSTVAGIPEERDDLQWSIDGDEVRVQTSSQIESVQILDAIGRQLHMQMPSGTEARVPLPRANTVTLLTVRLANGRRFTRKMPVLP